MERLEVQEASQNPFSTRTSLPTTGLTLAGPPEEGVGRTGHPGAVVVDVADSGWQGVQAWPGPCDQSPQIMAWA